MKSIIAALLLLAATPAFAAPASQSLTDRLESYQETYLEGWAPARNAAGVIEQLNEIRFQVTAPGGFWRKEVTGWLGCRKMPNSAQCLALSDAEGELERWDALLDKASNLKGRSAQRFLRKHQAELLRYLDRYVPASPSSSQMERTPFYTERLAGFAQDEGMLL